jgi:hypothetical protein
VDYRLEDGFVGRASRRPAGNACISEDDVKLAKVFDQFSEKPLAVLRNRNVKATACGRATVSLRRIRAAASRPGVVRFTEPQRPHALGSGSRSRLQTSIIRQYLLSSRTYALASRLWACRM